MKKKMILSLLHISVVLPLILLYIFILGFSTLISWIIYVFSILIIILLVKYRVDIKKIASEISYDRYISLISIEIALLAFIQAGIQQKDNNQQFEKNRIASDSLFETQLRHTTDLNRLLINNAQILNDSLIEELNEIQNINSKNSLSVDNQLLTTKSHLELSKQTLQDYVFNSRAHVVTSSTKITKRDTLDNKEVMLTLNYDIQNIGKRNAIDVETKHMIIYNNKIIPYFNASDKIPVLVAGTTTSASFYPKILLKESENFFYWKRVRYYDEKLGQYFVRSEYYRYFKTINGLNFYYVNKKHKPYLRKVVNILLKKNGYRLDT